jgi:hypothetical protein
MIDISSVESVRRGHTFENELGSIPIVDWPVPKAECKAEFVKNLKYLDGKIEVLLSDIKDEDLRIAVQRAFYSDEPIRSVKDVMFIPYLPQGKVQFQLGLMDEMKRARERPVTDAASELGLIALQTEWEVNPVIGEVKIDGTATKPRLQESLGLYRGHLKACEHEFYKQMASSKLGLVTHEFDMLMIPNGRKKFIDPGDFILDYSKMEGLQDQIYYRWARDYMAECSKCHQFLDRNEFSKKYLIEQEDVRKLMKL